MEITLADIGRRFNQDWVFRRLNYQFTAGHRYAVLGPNGSGKSTLLQVIASSLTPSSGQIRYATGGHTIEPDHIYRHISLVAPYMELIEEFTLVEQIRFHFTHKKYQYGLDEQLFMERLGLQHAKNKQIRYFSSGMKQRVKLALACYADTPVVLLDEPTTNLDHQGIDWYINLIDETKGDRLLLVCSNQEKEYGFCEHFIHITDYKA
ncbi:ABC transporter ATP-binding protein [Parapedobacter koreensis]|uniref:ABC-type multidrug transport system, ATPase component n=1 Tax=Parapedobacter koreensis TaxID=332977 RepID=A0A1H7QSF4_9SPHI|nr:ATP-binding cassette domain-containing protein [Parapedobacter koreensis]SEL50920.1 ABC-type multidrug transport system, ATPase component [Parapedobacter koreensis]